MATGSPIYASEYNNIRNKVALVLGPGSGQSGYGQSLNSAAEVIGGMVDAAGWNTLRNDLINIKLHQDGVTPTVVSPSAGGVIFYGSSHPNTSYNTIIDAATLTKFNVAGTRVIYTGRGTASTSTAWSTLAHCTATMTFGSAAAARYFFNSGGKFRMTSTLTGSVTPQSVAWSNLLSSAGIISFGAATATPVTVYQLTSTNQLIYTITDSGAYASNTFRIYARCNVANNSTGTATIFYIYVEWVDGHANPYYDSVTGTLDFSMNELRATGSMLPSGTFTITPPTYSLSAITLS